MRVYHLYIVLVMGGSFCAAGITLPDDIQFSLTADENEPIAEVGSPDSQQSASRMNEAGCVSFLHHPAHDRSDA